MLALYPSIILINSLSLDWFIIPVIMIERRQEDFRSWTACWVWAGMKLKVVVKYNNAAEGFQ